MLKLAPTFYSGTSINQDFYWYSSNTLKATVNSSTGEVTGVSPGTVTITGRKTYNGTYYYVTYTVIVTEIPNGTYFLKNKQTSDYAKVKSGTMTNGQSVVQYDFDSDLPERWIFKLDNLSGYYSIKSANSSNSYYMCVANNSTALDHPIVIRSATESTLSSGMKWKVEDGTDGAYKIIPKTGENLGYVLATSTSAGTNDAALIQGDYVVNNSYCDEWLLSTLEDYPNILQSYHVASTNFTIQCIGSLAQGETWYSLITASATAWCGETDS
jgi:hypothetical protein